MSTAGLAFRPKAPTETAKPPASDREILDTLVCHEMPIYLGMNTI